MKIKICNIMKKIENTKEVAGSFFLYRLRFENIYEYTFFPNFSYKIFEKLWQLQVSSSKRDTNDPHSFSNHGLLDQEWVALLNDLTKF